MAEILEANFLRICNYRRRALDMEENSIFQTYNPGTYQRMTKLLKN
jgi:hypothetical protein